VMILVHKAESAIFLTRNLQVQKATVRSSYGFGFNLPGSENQWDRSGQGIVFDAGQDSSRDNLGAFSLQALMGRF
jgi:hypothetical protein